MPQLSVGNKHTLYPNTVRNAKLCRTVSDVSPYFRESYYDLYSLNFYMSRRDNISVEIDINKHKCRRH
ncbi:MAG: hypothetical protein ABIF11_10450, partial [Nitrospirota bacterium]